MMPVTIPDDTLGLEFFRIGLVYSDGLELHRSALEQTADRLAVLEETESLVHDLPDNDRAHDPGTGPAWRLLRPVCEDGFTGGQFIEHDVGFQVGVENPLVQIRGTCVGVGDLDLVSLSFQSLCNWSTELPGEVDQSDLTRRALGVERHEETQRHQAEYEQGYAQRREDERPRPDALNVLTAKYHPDLLHDVPPICEGESVSPGSPAWRTKISCRRGSSSSNLRTLIPHATTAARISSGRAPSCRVR